MVGEQSGDVMSRWVGQVRRVTMSEPDDALIAGKTNPLYITA